MFKVLASRVFLNQDSYKYTIIAINCKSMITKIKKLNDGEREEILLKIQLCFFRDEEIEVPSLGKIISVGFDKDYNKINWSGVDIDKIKHNQKEIKILAEKLGITKSSSKDKADIKINGQNYSLKCTGYGKPAIVNHTNRMGWLKISKIINQDIVILDKIIDDYWKLRIDGEIKEDCPNFHEKSPFNNHIDIIKPYLDFFIFKGSGQGKSKMTAEKVLEFKSFDNTSAWNIYGSDYIEHHWNNIYFCMRSTKGMPTNYENYEHKNIISPWTRYFKGKKGEKKHRGALHVRVG